MKTNKCLTEKMAKLFSGKEKSVQKQKKEMQSLIDSARKEWEDAKQFFNFVDDPDLIDYSIYAIMAAEKKYIYLYKQVKNNT